MSAFMVEDKTINKIVSWLAEDRDIKPWLNHVHPEVKLNGEESLAEFGQALFDMNAESINQKYGENQAQEFRPMDYSWHFETPQPDIPIFAALECLLYQCCEGTVDESMLYKTMDSISNYLAKRIIHKLKAYEEAWG